MMVSRGLCVCVRLFAVTPAILRITHSHSAIVESV